MTKKKQIDAVDKFRSELMEKFIDLCRGNDFNKLTLLKIGDTVDQIYDKQIKDILVDEDGYRKQSENTMELPCKVGDTIYLPWKWKDTSGVAILTVERMSITEAGCSIRTDLWSDDEDYWLAYNCGVFYFEEIGKTVFLIKEEAEKALSKMKGGAE